MTNKKNTITNDVWVCTNCYHEALFKDLDKRSIEKDVFV